MFLDFSVCLSLPGLKWLDPHPDHASELLLWSAALFLNLLELNLWREVGMWEIIFKKEEVSMRKCYDKSSLDVKIDVEK